MTSTTIRYFNHFTRIKGITDKINVITREELDNQTNEFFNQGFAETLPQEGFKRLYFDIELNEYIDDDWLEFIINWINDLAIALNTTYKACGYTTNEKIIEQYNNNNKIKQHLMLEYKQDSTLTHVVSFHVIFKKVFEVKDIYTVFHDFKSCLMLEKGVDLTVYKSENKEQLLRHPFARKINNSSNITNTEIDFTKFEHPFKASDLVATPDGTEPRGSYQELYDLFVDDAKVKKTDFIINKAKTENSYIDSNNNSNNDDDINPDEVVKRLNENNMSKELFEALYKGFKNLEVHNNVNDCVEEITLYPLFSSLYKCVNDNITEDDVDEAIDFIQNNTALTKNARKDWNRQLRKAMKNDKCEGPGALFKYLQTFNKSYYDEVVKPLLPKRKQIVEAKFDLKDSFCIKDIRTKGVNREYQIDNDAELLNYTLVLNDLKRVMLVVDQGSGIYVIKERDAKNDRMTVNYYNQETAFKMLKQLKVGTELNERFGKVMTSSAFDVYNASTNNAMFYKSSICFYSTNEDDFSYFQGYKYEPKRDDKLIEKFNAHIKNIICSNDEALYNYVQSWFATIIQNPLAMTEIALVIKGSEGTGKNTMTNVWSELLKGYANGNVTDIDSIIGKYNSAVENKKLLVINEMDSAEMSPKSIFNRLKKLITEDVIDIHSKFVNTRPDVRSVANVMILSNEFNPVNISTTDRRYCIITPSEAKAQNKQYFNEVYADMKESRTSPYRKDFMEAIMYYYMNYKVNIDITEIPETRERAIAKEANKSAIELFVEENAVELSGDGIEPNECFELFNKFIFDGRFKTNYKKTTFKAEMTKFCAIDENNQLKRYKMKRVYRFNDTYMTRYADLVEQIKADRKSNINVAAMKEDEVNK